MRPLALLLTLSSCDFDMEDLDDDTRPSAARRCDREAQAGDRLSTIEEYNQAYQRCLHGAVSPGDGGATD
jgi:hypothetical protein